MKRIIKGIIALVVVALACVCTARANFIETGQIQFTGNFTLNHLYNFNDQSAAPFGWFGTQTVNQVSGIFAPYVQNGNTLSGSTALWTVPSGYPNWQLGGFNLLTNFVSITGADFAGRFCLGILDMSGNGYNQGSDYVHWEFIAPPYDISHFDHDITGPISLLIIVGYDNGHVPDSGGTILMFGLSVACIACIRLWRQVSGDNVPSRTGKLVTLRIRDIADETEII